MKMQGVYHHNTLIALFPTRAQAEKFVVPTTFREFNICQRQAAEYGFLHEIIEVECSLERRR